MQSSWAPAIGLALFWKLGIDGAQNKWVLPQEANILLWLPDFISGLLLSLHTGNCYTQGPKADMVLPPKADLTHVKIFPNPKSFFSYRRNLNRLFSLSLSLGTPD